MDIDEYLLNNPENKEKSNKNLQLQLIKRQQLKKEEDNNYCLPSLETV